MTPTEIRARVDASHPRTGPDGRVNAAHVAEESTLRLRYGHPGWIADLDGPGRFIPGAEPCDHVRRSCEEIGCSGDGRRPRVCTCSTSYLHNEVARATVSDEHLPDCPMRSTTPHPQEPRHEVPCPSCGATIRARMADAPDVTTWQLEWPTPPGMVAATGGATTVHPLRNAQSDEDALEALQAVDPSGLRGVRAVRLETTRTALGEDGPE